MAEITKTSMSGSGSRAVAITILGASDTLIYTNSKNATLILNNVTGGALTPLILGDTATEVACSGVGNIDVSAGVTLPLVGIGDTVAIPLDSISGFLKGVITITGGDAMEAQILEF